MYVVRSSSECFEARCMGATMYKLENDGVNTKTLHTLRKVFLARGQDSAHMWATACNGELWPCVITTHHHLPIARYRPPAITITIMHHLKSTQQTRDERDFFFCSELRLKSLTAKCQATCDFKRRQSTMIPRAL